MSVSPPPLGDGMAKAQPGSCAVLPTGRHPRLCAAPRDAIAALATAIREQVAADQREREAIAIERGLQANRWSGLAATLESIDTSMDTLAHNATLVAAA